MTKQNNLLQQATVYELPEDQQTVASEISIVEQVTELETKLQVKEKELEKEREKLKKLRERKD